MTDQTNSPKITVPTEIRAAIEKGAVIAISMSGGKDSQAMASALVRYIDEHHLDNKVVAVHADLGRAEWFDTMETLTSQVQEFGLDLEVVQRSKGDLLQRIQERAEKVGDEKVFWPSSAARYCTSDLKRNPIDKFLRTLGPLVISCEGLRRDESVARAKKPCWEPRKQITNSKRDALTWRPIHFWTTEDVWTELGTSGEDLERHRAEYALEGTQEEKDLALIGWPAHAAYVRGNDRLSCSICILASKSDIENGARHNPEYLAELVALEERYGFTFKADLSLVELAKRLKAEEQANAPEETFNQTTKRWEPSADRAHYIEDENLLGQPVMIRVTKTIRDDVWLVHERVIVNGIGGADTFYPMDTVEGRQRLALSCISPDMLTEENAASITATAVAALKEAGVVVMRWKEGEIITDEYKVILEDQPEGFRFSKNGFHWSRTSIDGIVGALVIEASDDFEADTSKPRMWDEMEEEVEDACGNTVLIGPRVEPKKPLKTLTWTDHRFYCTECDTGNVRASREHIEDAKNDWGDSSTDAEAVNTFCICLDCAGYGDEFDLTGEKDGATTPKPWRVYFRVMAVNPAPWGMVHWDDGNVARFASQHEAEVFESEWCDEITEIHESQVGTSPPLSRELA